MKKAKTQKRRSKNTERKPTRRGSKLLADVPKLDPGDYGESTADAMLRAGHYHPSKHGLVKDPMVSPLSIAKRKRLSAAQDALRDGLDDDEIVYDILMARRDELCIDTVAEAQAVLTEARAKTNARYHDVEAVRVRQMARLEKSAERAFAAREYTAHAALERGLAELAGTKAPERIEMRSTAVIADMGGAEIQRYLESLRGPLDGPKARAFEVMTKLSTAAALPAGPGGPETGFEHGGAPSGGDAGAGGPGKQG